ncbi:MAG: betaine/proline/choline family ABC transporter ATP-binding protein [Trueperaceae bacterium]|nr:betaine/proline/choline family ABC transporter ATP-binding protein [Trueperaceae bacterium]
MIRVEALHKVFGPTPEHALALLAEGRSKDEIRAETGHVIGVQNVSFALKPGEFFVIMGLSGSGKSTLLRAINRLIEPTSGHVWLTTDDGEVDVAAADKRALRGLRQDHLAMVFQRFGLLPHRSVRENVAYGLEVKGVGRAERTRRAEEVIEMVGLGGWGASPPSALSGGMQQRVGLARAIATGAKVLLMDEPFSALDPLIKMQMQDEMIRLQRQLGRTIVFITHDLDEALRLGDRIAIMEDGRFVQIGTPERIITEPRTPYVADFVAHADPTGVITAATVAVPPDHERVDVVGQEAGARVLAHRTQPDVEIVVEPDGRVREVRADGARAVLVAVDELLAEETPGSRHRDRVPVVRGERTLKTLLEARNRCNLPLLVVDEDERLIGIVTEREIIHSTIEKRGPNGDTAAVAA